MKYCLITLFALIYIARVRASWFWPSSSHPSHETTSASLANTDLIRSLLGNVVSSDTHFPKIFRTPNSYNALFDLPGFHPQDLHVSLDEDTIHVEGHTWCPKTSDQSTSWFGERFVNSERDLCIERHVNAHVTLPKNMKEHGSVRALFENGVLRVAVPLHKDQSRGYARKLVDVLTGGSKSSEGVLSNMPVYEGTGRDMYEAARRSAGEAGDRVREGMGQAQNAASRGAEYVGDTARYVREKGAEYGEEYIKRPIQRAGANVAESVRDTSQNVANRAEDMKQRVRPNAGHEMNDHSKGIYERASEVIHNAADTVMHPFRKGGGGMDAGSYSRSSGEDEQYVTHQKIPVKEGRVVNEF